MIEKWVIRKRLWWWRVSHSSLSVQSGHALYLPTFEDAVEVACAKAKAAGVES